MNEAGAIVLVMISLGLMLASVVILGFYFRYRARSDAQGTIRTALEKGQPLSPEVLAGLMNPNTARPDRSQIDLRRGVIATAIGLGICFIGAVATWPTWGEGVAFGALPLLIGVAYIALWKLGPRG